MLSFTISRGARSETSRNLLPKSITSLVTLASSSFMVCIGGSLGGGCVPSLSAWFLQSHDVIKQSIK